MDRGLVTGLAAVLGYLLLGWLIRSKKHGEIAGSRPVRLLQPTLSQAGSQGSSSDSVWRLALESFRHAEERRLSKTGSTFQLFLAGRALFYLKEPIVSRTADGALVRRLAIDRVAADATDKDPLF
jgi:hypothetical protein